MNIMWYRVGKIIRSSSLILVIYTIIWVGCGILFENGNYMMIEDMILMIEDMIWIAPIIAEVYPLKEMQEYQTFCFSRKKLFGFCILGEGIRAFIYGGIFRTTFQVLFYSEYVKIYTEDAPKEIANQYHQCPVWELFLVNMVVFFLLRLILVFDSTRKYPAFDFANTLNKKKKAIMSRKRKWIHRIVEIPALFSVVISFLIFVEGSYDFMLRNTIREKIGIYSIILVASAVFLIILWWRIRAGKKIET